MTTADFSQQDFERLFDFRVALRGFQRWSEHQARTAGLTHVQHQLLVAIKGHHENQPPTMGDLAGYLLLRPHSAVELVDRAAAAGLVRRTADDTDGRIVRVTLTGYGDRIVRQLTKAHLERLRDLAGVLDGLVAGDRSTGDCESAAVAGGNRRGDAHGRHADRNTTTGR